MPPDAMVASFRQQADACGRLGSPLYAALLERAADDVAAGGPCAEAVAAHAEAAAADAVPLRLAGGVHALALTGRAPRLAAHYPSAGGVFDSGNAAAAWPAFREAVAAELPWLRAWLARPPQTNEVGRAVMLLVGLLSVLPRPQLPVRLFELGSSAGLLLRADQYRYVSDAFTWGPPDSPVRLTEAWRGEVPDWLRQAAARSPALRVVERHGCDPDPIDPLSPGGALALRAYLWPDQLARAARLEGALSVAAKVPATVEAAGAAEFLAGVQLETGTMTVVWHSVTRQYIDPAEWARVERELDRLARAATADAGFAYLSFEPHEREGFCLTVRTGRAGERHLAVAPAHGLPASWHGPG